MDSNTRAIVEKLDDIKRDIGYVAPDLSALDKIVTLLERIDSRLESIEEALSEE